MLYEIIKHAFKSDLRIYITAVFTIQLNMKTVVRKTTH